MKKNTRKNNTVKAAAVNEVGNSTPVQQTVADPVNTPEVQAPAAEKATNDQLKLIGRAVKENKISRFTKEDWNALTKDAAAKIINENHLTEEQLRQKLPCRKPPRLSRLRIRMPRRPPHS